MWPIVVKGLDHVVLRVADLDRSIAFYCDGIGCGVQRRRDDLGMIHLAAGAAQIDLVALDGPLGRKGGAAAGKEARNMDHFCLQVAPFDADAIRRHLRERGIEAGAVEQRFGAEGTGPSIYLTDPDGNVVELKGPATTKE